jgi:hypothetical protein
MNATEQLSVSDMFHALKTVYTEELHQWLKTEFSDVCSNGDVYINQLLDDLHSFHILKKQEIRLDTQNFYVSHIYDRYLNNYLVGQGPNPWRA